MGKNTNRSILNKQAAMFRKLTEAETCHKNDNTLHIWEKSLIVYQYF